MQNIFLFLVALALVITLVFIFIRHWRMQLQGEITRRMFLRNVLLEIFGVFIAIVLAGLLYRYIAETMILPMASKSTRLVANVIVALLVGTCTGNFVNRTWGKLTKI